MHGCWLILERCKRNGRVSALVSDTRDVNCVSVLLQVQRHGVVGDLAITAAEVLQQAEEAIRRRVHPLLRLVAP